MSVIWEAEVADYLNQRRARGYTLRDASIVLERFAAALGEAGAERITVPAVTSFACQDIALGRASQARRFGIVRAFAGWMRATDPATADPIPPGLVRGAYQRVTPHLYPPDQVLALMAATDDLGPRWLAEAMGVLIGLLSVTGLRSGEAIGLDVGDLDASGLVLTVHGKLDRSRLVPLHPTSADKISAYCGDRTSGPLFIGRTGSRICRPTVHGAFRRLTATCRIPTQTGGRPPRLHDFRHTLAVDSLVAAHRHGLDVDARIAVLSTFLGHREPASTYWYLTASPELMAAVSDRMAHALKRQPR